ncbi:hypothetical protein [Microbulbifer taiwanensis]|uniref:hypothetical protein n=1 Tax=Microbulbifer taiwanensis TaxID=986746 RepID=UPI0036206FFA
MAKNKSFSWILLHGAAIATATLSLLTGLRIATLSSAPVAAIEELLPQGQVHSAHFFSAAILTLVAILYCSRHAGQLLCGRLPDFTRMHYQKAIIWLGSLVLLISLGSGWLLFSGWGQSAQLRTWHFTCALALGAYIFLHGGVYFVRSGRRALTRILLPAASPLARSFFVVALLSTIILFGWQALTARSPTNCWSPPCRWRRPSISTVSPTKRPGPKAQHWPSIPTAVQTLSTARPGYRCAPCTTAKRSISISPGRTRPRAWYTCP